MDFASFIKRIRIIALIGLLAAVAMVSCKPREEDRGPRQSPCESAMLVTNAFKCLSGLR